MTILFYENFKILDTSKWHDGKNEAEPAAREPSESDASWALFGAGYHIISNGIIRLKADNISNRPGYLHTSAKLSTIHRFKFRYGLVELRAKLPASQGMWPAFWLLEEFDRNGGHSPVVEPFEIDVMEFINDNENRVYMNRHYRDANGDNQYDAPAFSYTGNVDLTADYHTYGCDWRADSLTYYLDGVRRHLIKTNIPDAPMYLMIQLAVGGWAGAADTTTDWPSYLDVDWVKVTSNDDTPTSFWHGYYLLENVSLTARQFGVLRGFWAGLGDSIYQFDPPNPANILHKRTAGMNRLLIEAKFDTGYLTVERVAAWLASPDLLNVDPTTVGDALQQTAYGPMVTYSRSGTDYIHLLAFGGIGVSWETSRQATLAYLAANRVE